MKHLKWWLDVWSTFLKQSLDDLFESQLCSEDFHLVKFHYLREIDPLVLFLVRALGQVTIFEVVLFTKVVLNLTARLKQVSLLLAYDRIIFRLCFLRLRNSFFRCSNLTLQIEVSLALLAKLIVCQLNEALDKLWEVVNIYAVALVPSPLTGGRIFLELLL